MKIPEYPSPEFLHAFEITRIHTVAAAASVAYIADDQKRADMLQEAMEAAARAQGNRGERMPITWADLKYRLASSLRVCLEHLEK